MPIDKGIYIEMEKVIKSLNLPSGILETSGELIKKLYQERSFKGQSILAIAMACIYYMIKLDPSCPAITIHEFAGQTSVTRKKIYHYYSKIVDKFGIQPQVCTIRPTIFVKSFGQKIGFRKEVLDFAVNLAEDSVNKKTYVGKSPSVWASACLYIASVKFGEGITQEEIAEGSGVNQVSIRNAFKESTFFSKVTRSIEAPQLVPGELLKKLICKLLSVDSNGIQLIHLRQALRCSFAEELKGFFISVKKLDDVLIDLEFEGIVKRIFMYTDNQFFDYLIKLR